MSEKCKKAESMASDLSKIVSEMIPQTGNLDLQRVLKQVDADLMDIKHKLSTAVKIAEKGV